MLLAGLGMGGGGIWACVEGGGGGGGDDVGAGAGGTAPLPLWCCCLTLPFSVKFIAFFFSSADFVAADGKNPIVLSILLFGCVGFMVYIFRNIKLRRNLKKKKT